jgi:O-antigen/teichoic acid export membrane protein
MTIWIARILTPSDYGLMEMAMMLSAYALLFNELGLGRAIIQRPDIKDKELSSIFWFSTIVSIVLGISCFGLAYITAYIFNEPRVIPLTMATSAIFITSGLQIVPLNLLKKELKFKKVGQIEMITVILSSTFMLFIALAGGGAWTLIGGYILRSFVTALLLFYFVSWRPKFHFVFREALDYIKFGIVVAFTGSLSYLNEKVDRFFAARAWTPKLLGYYSMALELAQIPTEKIVVLINQVSFSAFAQLQKDQEKFRDFYGKSTKITITLVFPIFVGVFLLADEFIRVLLNEKWYPIVFLVKYLALTQIMTAINAINNVVHIAQGRPKWSMNFNGARVILMGVSFYFAVQIGLKGVIIPWGTTYTVLCLAWILITLKKIGMEYSSYLKIFQHPVLATALMSIGILLLKQVNYMIQLKMMNLNFYLVVEVIVGALLYLGYFWIFNRQIYYSIIKLAKS